MPRTRREVSTARRVIANKGNGDQRTRRPEAVPGGPSARWRPPVAPAAAPNPAPAAGEPPTLPVPPEREALGSMPPLHSGFREAYVLLVDLRGSPNTWIALILATGVLGVIILNMVGQVRLKTWQGDFFDAIEKKFPRASAASF